MSRAPIRPHACREHPPRAGWRLLACLLACLALLQLPALAPDAAHAAAPVSDAPAASFLRDASGALELRDVIALAERGRFLPMPAGAGNFGSTRDAIWLRVELRNDGYRSAEQLVEIDYPYLDDVEFHIPAGHAGGPRTVRTGDHRPFASRGFEHRNFVFPVALAAGASTEVYVRVRSSTAVQVPLRVHSASAFAATEQIRLLLLGAYFGVALAMIFYNLSVYAALREPAYPAYVAFVGVFGLFHFCLNGFAFQYLFPDSPALGEQSAYLFLGPALAAALQFARAFLGSRERMPRLDRIARWLQLPLLASGLAALVFRGLWVGQLAQALALGGCAVGLAMGVLAARAGYTPARWYLLAVATLVASGTAMVLRNQGLLPWNTLTANGTQIGAALEALLLGLALSERLRGMQQRTLLAQKQALDAARRAEQDLESQVGLRTAELAASNARLREEIRERELAEERLRESEERLRRLAQRDPLTGAGNRNLLAERSAELLASARRHGRRFGVVVIDIDSFKSINDTHGHEVGDRLLVSTATRLESELRTTDLLARVGGDEFIVLLPDLNEAAGLQLIVDKLRDALEQPLELPGERLLPRASFGGALYPEDGGDIDTLIRHADLAMYADKQSRREDRRSGSVL